MQKIVLLILCLQLSITGMYGFADRVPALIDTEAQELLLNYHFNEAGPRSNKKVSQTKKILVLSALAAGSVLMIYLGYRGIKFMLTDTPDQNNNQTTPPNNQLPEYKNTEVMWGAIIIDTIVDVSTKDKETGNGFLSEQTAKKTSHLVNRVASFIDKIATDIEEDA